MTTFKFFGCPLCRNSGYRTMCNVHTPYKGVYALHTRTFYSLWLCTRVTVQPFLGVFAHMTGVFAQFKRVCAQIHKFLMFYGA
jgi:hypothetical protein